MSNYFERLKTGTSDLFKQAHASPDTDESRDAMHHTLGATGNQAAPGNHSHYFPGKSEGFIGPDGLVDGYLPNDSVTYDVYAFTTIPVPVEGVGKASVATITVFFNARAGANAACHWYLKNSGVIIDTHDNHNWGDQYMGMGAVLTGSVDVRKLSELAITVSASNDATSGTSVLCGVAHVSVSFT